MRRRPTRQTITNRIGLHNPLARWGFAVLAALALLTEQAVPCLLCTATAIYAWKNAR